ncbi:hypothetical protein LOTGIDRAFT_132351 [Lottia gigantea]|uniref:Pre-mRNA-splicing factor 18 n=1 Tax=Lottia gigantea TaxID=225164 RepID=V4B769_LOTGI|nr:hypothetical protein LOTGIDRAFT_132351 [Lottia gigantea]ESO84399.1 hypothetical protein LOTGIDRAFT_132351 [Lottia gigantea]
MDFLKAEIERKKRQITESNVLAPDKKYFKRGDLAAKQAEEYWRKHGRLQNDPTNSKENGESSDVKTDTAPDDKQHILPRKEVIRKLRERNEPIRLFGEEDFDSYQRLKKLEVQEPDVNKGHGYENDFKTAMDKVDEEYLVEIMKGEGSLPSNDVSVKDDGTTNDDIDKMRCEIGKGDPKKDQEVMLRFFKFILKLWGEELNQREETLKRTNKGKMQSATHTQTVAYLKPLFKKLKNAKVDEDILDSMVYITEHVMDRDYIKANDRYLEMAIGNAPWPIGVTMVGIHARTGREKISSRYVAHVLNDETQRKYIQALKRLMTQAQKLFPTDPSKSFNYKSPV